MSEIAAGAPRRQRRISQVPAIPADPQDAVTRRRTTNTAAARRSRARKAQEREELKATVAQLEEQLRHMRKRAEDSEELVRNMIVREKQNALPSGYRSTVSTIYSLTGTAPDIPQPPQPSPEDAFSFSAGFRTFPNHLYNMPDVPSSDRLAPPAKARKRETSEVAKKAIRYTGQAARRQIKTAIKGTKGPNPYLREMAKLAHQSTSSPSSTSRSDAVPYDWQRARKEAGDLPLGNSNEGELPEEEDGEDEEDEADEADEADEDDDEDEDEDDDNDE